MLKVNVNTDDISDRFVIRVDPKISEEELLEIILNEYRKWHAPIIHGFQIVDKNNEIVVKESERSLLKKKLALINNQIIRKHKIKMRNLFSNPYNLNWSYQSQVFDVNLYDPCVIEKDYVGYGCAITNFLFTHGCFCIEIEIIDMTDIDPVWIGLYSIDDKNYGRNLEDGNYSISYSSKGLISNCKTNHQYQPFGKNDKLILALFSDGIIIKKIGSEVTFIQKLKFDIINVYRHFIAISTNQKKCSFRLRYLDEKYIFDNNILKTTDINYAKFTNEYNELKIYLNRLENRYSEGFIQKLIEYSKMNEIHVWDQLFLDNPININYIDYPDFHTAKIISNSGRYCYFKTIAIFEKGMHFFEVEMKNVPIGLMSFVGIISKDYNFINNTGKYLGYNNTGSVHYYNGNTYRNYGKQVIQNGTKIGIFIDLDNDLIEFLIDGEIQNFALKINFNCPIQFFVTMTSKNSEYKILPSNLETYFAYVEYNTKFKGMVTISKNSVGISQIDEMKCKVEQNFKILTSKKYNNGRQYFEIICNNISGDIRFGFSDYNYEISLGNAIFDIDEIDIFDDNYIDKKKDTLERRVTLGILVDFDERVIELYRNRIMINQYPQDNDIIRQFTGYISGSNVNTIDPGDMIIELNNNACDEMKDTLILYD